ncbi:MAG: M64 family metallopeptidase [Bacteroidales bacterium]|nr:M64 family metallopeptidase [Bacteroidales bacterium]
MKNISPLMAGICLLLVFQTARSQDFDQYFDQGVMRIDLVFSGSAGETSYALSGVKKEQFYSGSRLNLTDPFDYGDHKFVVKSDSSGEIIFSHSYCTLFREWQTTEESQKIRRAYPHVLRFPWPKAAVVVEIHDRNSAGVFEKGWSASFDPASIYWDPGNPFQFESADLEIHGSPEEKVDILFLAEGYQREEMDKFLEDARRSAGYIFSEEPFTGKRKQFNIRAVKSFSRDSGTDIPGEGIWKNTVLNSSFYTFGVERYMTTMDYRAVCDVAACEHYDQIYILVNTDKYGGGGIYNHYSISAADNIQSRAVVIHEFGHSFCGLADEYYSSAVAYNDYFPLDVEPWNPNLTTLLDFDSKWKQMVPEGTPVPTPAEDKNRDIVGVYEGGGYVAKGVFRPMMDCRMHTNEAVFCPVCSEALLRMIKRVTGL